MTVTVVIAISFKRLQIKAKNWKLQQDLNPAVSYAEFNKPIKGKKHENKSGVNIHSWRKCF